MKLSPTTVLKTLQKTGSIQQAANELGVSESIIRLYAYALASQGLLKIDSAGRACNCGTCPLRKLCGVS